VGVGEKPFVIFNAEKQRGRGAEVVGTAMRAPTGADHEPGVARHEQLCPPINSSAISQKQNSLYSRLVIYQPSCVLLRNAKAESLPLAPRHYQNHILHFLSHPTSLLL